MIRSPIWSSICSLESIFIVFCIFEQGPWQCNNFSRHQTKYIGAISSSQLQKLKFYQTRQLNFFHAVTLAVFTSIGEFASNSNSFGFQKLNVTLSTQDTCHCEPSFCCWTRRRPASQVSLCHPWPCPSSTHCCLRSDWDHISLTPTSSASCRFVFLYHKRYNPCLKRQPEPNLCL